MTNDSASTQESTSSPADQIITFLQGILHPDPETAAEGPQKQKRGHPVVLSQEHLWLALLVAILRGMPSFASVWRLISWQGVGNFPLLKMTRDGVRKRLINEQLDSLQELLRRVTNALLRWTAPCADADLAPFAPQVVALDESTLDAVRRLSNDVRNEARGNSRLLVGKLAGLFDLRRQQWIRLHFREDVLANCKADVQALIDGLAPRSLILADLGYFGFPWFDWLTDQGYWWLSRLRERTSYELVTVLLEQPDVLDALIWLGAYRADRSKHLVRLIQFSHQGICYRYITNVLDPQLLSIHDAARLYARRWDIELAFKLLKKELGISLWWACHPTLVLQQLWAALILAQILHALHLQVAFQAGVDLFEVSMPVLVSLIRQAPQDTRGTSLVSLLADRGCALGLIRPSRRYRSIVPAILKPYAPLPTNLPLPRLPRQSTRKDDLRSPIVPFLPRFTSCLMI
jgi:hypothetical protein